MFYQKGPELDFKSFSKNLDKTVFRLKKKKYDLDEIMEKVQKYLF